MFLKPSTAVVGRHQIAYPPFYPPGGVRGRAGRGHRAAVPRGPAARAAEVVFGYTCANDVTARDLQQREGQWARAKGFDTFCPLGPWIETEVDPADLAVTTSVNGEVRQRARTSQMVLRSRSWSCTSAR